jgi:hypothetical protein
MKKYFVVDTEEEVQFGDMIESDFIKKDEDTGRPAHHHLECTFAPEVVDFLIANGIIECRDDEDAPEEEGIDKALYKNINEINERLSHLEDVLLGMTEHMMWMIEHCMNGEPCEKEEKQENVEKPVEKPVTTVKKNSKQAKK